MTLTFAVYLLLSLVFLSLTLSVFYDIPQFSKYHTLLKLLWCHVPMNQSVISGSFSDLGLHLNKHRDIYLDEEQNSTSDSGHKKTDFKPKRFLCFKRQPSNASNEWKVQANSFLLSISAVICHATGNLKSSRAILIFLYVLNRIL